MAKPQIKNISPFDATKDYDLSIMWAGDMAYKNRLIIYDNDTLVTIYDKTITTFYLRHTIPANTLINGKKYLAQVQVFNRTNEASPLSDKLLFSVLKTPTFYFKNINNGDLVNNSSLTASVHYEQENWELIGSYKFYLYDSLKQLLLESETYTEQDNILYTYRGLENSTSYFVRCKGITVNGMDIDTGYIQITVNFVNPSKYSKIYATNFPDKGYNTYETNVKIIQYNGDKKYKFENGFIDLTDNEITYDEGFNIATDFTLMVRGKRLDQAALIFTGHNGENRINLSSYIYDVGKIRYKLVSTNALTEYILYSEDLVFGPTDIVTIWIRRINNVYGLKIYIEYGDIEQVNMWFGNTPPTTAKRYEQWIDSPNEKTELITKENVKFYTNSTPPDNVPLFALWIGGE